MKDWIGITYPEILCNCFILNLWNKTLCKTGWHLFDEVISDTHYLSCDACGLIVIIKKDGRNGS
jgi:hypothetical protein